MEDKESGSLSQRPALELIVELYQGAVTGSLKLERAPLQKAVYFRDGQILFAASNDPKDQLASILVEEGKLGPDQMQVAQARVSSGNPLAKVLTELGYISQRELADAARIKVEKILTDLYMWVEGTYQFATKSLPKGAIDLDLSTPQLIYASIRRIQDREWILREIGTLETVLAPTGTLDTVIQQTQADPQATEALRLVDGVKSVQQIGALSSLGEFEVCKTLVAGLIVGGLTKNAAGVAAADDAFSIPTDGPTFEPPPAPVEIPGLGGLETVGLPTTPPPPLAGANDDAFSSSEATVFEAPPETEKTVFDPAPPPVSRDSFGAPPLEPPPPPLGTPSIPGTGLPGIPDSPDTPDRSVSPSTTASELLIDEPEPDVDESSVRTPPRPRHMRGGGSSSRNLGGILKIAGVILLAAGAAFAAYTFVWPLIGGSGGDTSTASGPTTAVTPPTPSPTPPSGASTTPPGPAPPSPSEPTGTDARAATGPRATGPRPAPPAAPTSVPPASAGSKGATRPRRPTTTTPAQPPRTSPSAPRGSSAPSGSSGGARQLLASGDLTGAARGFVSELRSSGNKFTIAVGLYCNEDNVNRIVQSASGSNQLYLVPTTLDGRRCYRVLWGLFDSRAAANQAKSSLPNGIRAGDTAAVPLTGLLR